ncbi:MAG TPA: NAD-dependent epimerase/dehydratase family protein [Candidatus Nanopelagicales bacterium]|nr:NAD-dependent epimerase/dehydratase family protein [Candidatus Nanopelagicales bacterium]
MTTREGSGGTPAANAEQRRRSGRAGARPRPARKAAGSVVVTGAAGAIGSVLLDRLAASDDVGTVVALDLVRGVNADVTWRTGDVRDPGVAAVFAGADAVIHLAVDWRLESAPAQRTDLNVRGTQTVVTAAAAAGVRRAVIVSSAAVYGAQPDNPIPLAEDAPLRAVPEGIAADLLEIERVAEDARRVHPGLDVVVVRPAALVGPGVDTLITRHFAAPRLLVIKDTAPAWQFCHVEDLASALELAALGRVSGTVTCGSDGYLTQQRLEDLSGMKRVEIPASLALATAERLHRVGVTPAPASELAYVMHPLVVPSTTLRVAGWAAQHDNEECLAEVLTQVEGERALAGRRIGKRDATVAATSAAGATVAVLGAAAFVRAARKARSR